MLERLVVFAKAPRLGRVKTRLCPPLRPDQALLLHQALVADTLERFALFERSDLERQLYWSHPVEPREFSVPLGWSVRRQSEGDLGERMQAAMQEAFDQGMVRVVILGSDSPTLPFTYVHSAFDKLTSVDVALGPSDDGGYYLAGCRRSAPELFRDIDWGTSRVLEQTLGALKSTSLSVALLDPWYDIDQAADLRRLQEEIDRLQDPETSQLPRATAALLRRLVF